MWCPPGYLSLEGFDEICAQAGEMLFSRPDGYVLEPQEDGTISFEKDPSFYAMFLHLWLVAQYVERTDTKVSLCSPDGVVVDVSSRFFLRRDTGEPDHWSISPTRTSYPEIRDVFIQHHHGWENVDSDGLVCVPRYAVLARLRGAMKAALHRRSYPSIVFQVLLRQAKLWWSEREDRARTKRFVGWSVCFRDGTFPPDAKALLAFFDADLSTASPPQADPKLRHAGKRNEILSILTREFPGGFDGIPAKVLQSALAQHFAKLPHEDTVRRAIGRKG